MPYQNYEQWKSTPVDGVPTLSVVIPAYNEAIRILPTIGSMASHICDTGIEWELIVSDDGSTDETAELVESTGFVNLRLEKAERNKGKGDAVRRGLLAAKGEYVLFADADSSTPIEQLNLLLDPLKSGGYDVAVGSRHAEGSEVVNKSLFRKVLSGGLHQIVKRVLGVKVRDTQCGFKMFTRDAAHRLAAAQTIEGFSFDLEQLFIAYKVGYNVLEVAVEWHDAPGSKVNARKEIQRFISDIATIRVNDLKGVYADA